jgi:hypothetical protein
MTAEMRQFRNESGSIKFFHIRPHQIAAEGEQKNGRRQEESSLHVRCLALPSSKMML